MAPEHDAPRAFYDHESSESAPRRRRAAADWGVGEDIFDRMPSRRFKRTDRRAEHHEDLESRRFERRTSGPSPERNEETPRRDDWADDHERRQVAPRRDDWPAAPAADRRPARRPAESWTEGDEQSVPVEGKRPIESWLEPEPKHELTLVPGESRTIVLGTSEPDPEPPARRTVVISGHPDRLPVPRTPRRPRTAVERIGASPDRIVGYAVLLGFVLVLIAILTTGQ
jgi:hypothetical protein